MSVIRFISSLLSYHIRLYNPTRVPNPKLCNGVSVSKPLGDVDVVYPCGDAQFSFLRLSIRQLVISFASGMGKLLIVDRLCRAHRR